MKTLLVFRRLLQIFSHAVEYFGKCFLRSNCVMVLSDHQLLESALVSLADKLGVATIYDAVFLTVYKQCWNFAFSDILQADCEWIELKFCTIFLCHF